MRSSESIKNGQLTIGRSYHGCRPSLATDTFVTQKVLENLVCSNGVEPTKHVVKNDELLSSMDCSRKGLVDILVLVSGICFA